jgi:hypothetical protein
MEDRYCFPGTGTGIVCKVMRALRLLLAASHAGDLGLILAQVIGFTVDKVTLTDQRDRAV